jgi:hypothetical protein
MTFSGFRVKISGRNQQVPSLWESQSVRKRGSKNTYPVRALTSSLVSRGLCCSSSSTVVTYWSKSDIRQGPSILPAIDIIFGHTEDWSSDMILSFKVETPIPISDPYPHPIKIPIPVIMAPKYKEHGSYSRHSRNTCRELLLVERQQWQLMWLGSPTSCN